MSRKNEERMQDKPALPRTTNRNAMDSIVAAMTEFFRYAETMDAILPNEPVSLKTREEILGAPLNHLMSDPCLWDSYVCGVCDSAQAILSLAGSSVDRQPPPEQDQPTGLAAEQEPSVKADQAESDDSDEQDMSSDVSDLSSLDDVYGDPKEQGADDDGDEAE